LFGNVENSKEELNSSNAGGIAREFDEEFGGEFGGEFDGEFVCDLGGGVVGEII
jgi:hypothetical protein